MSELSAGEIYEKNIGSVVAVLTREGQGSGVVVGPDEVVTVCHVIKGGPIHVVAPRAGDSRAGRLAASSGRDLCLLRTRGLRARPAELGASGSVRTGDSLYAIGHPGLVAGAYCAGLASPSRGPGEGAEEVGHELQASLSLSRGFSGGGVFDGHGRLAGFAVGQIGESGNQQHCLPVELSGYLRGRAEVEGPLLSELSRALGCPSGERLRTLAERIASSLSDARAAAFARRLWAEQEGERADRDWHGRQRGRGLRQGQRALALLRGLSGVSSGFRDVVRCEASGALAAGGRWRPGLRLAEETEDGARRRLCHARLVRSLAGRDPGGARRLRGDYAGLWEDAEEDSPDWLLEKGLVFASLGEWESALRQGERLLSRCPEDGTSQAELCGCLGSAFRQRGCASMAGMLFREGERLALSAAATTDQLFGLALLFGHAARSGDAESGLRALSELERLSGDDLGFGESYVRQLSRWRLEAEGWFQLGEVGRGLRSLGRMRTLGHDVVSGLAGAAIALERTEGRAGEE